MIKFRLYLVFQFFILLVGAQNNQSLNDSISKYLYLNPQKSLEFGLEALSTDNLSNSELYRTHYLFGQNLFSLGLYEESVKYLIQAQELYSNLPKAEKKIFQVDHPWMLNTIGNIYYKRNKPNSAKDYYNQALSIFLELEEDVNNEKIYGLNGVETNLALLSLEEKEYEQALKYFQTILERREKSKKQSDIILSYTQFMNFYLELEQYEKADEYLNKISELFNSDPKYQELENTSELKKNYLTAMIVYASHLASKNNLDKVIQIINELKPLAKALQTEYHDLNYLLAKTYNENDIDGANKLINENLNIESIGIERKLLNYNLLMNIYEKEIDFESLSRIKDSILLNQNKKISALSKVDNVENLITLADKQREISDKELRFNRTILSFIGAITLLIFGLMLLRFNLKFQQEKNKVLELEKLQVVNELNTKKRELFSKTNYILQRNDYLKSLLEQVNQNKPGEDLPNRIKRQISKIISSKVDHEEFDKKFVEVFPQFYKELNSRYTLSKTDFRLVAYIKMNKSNNEIAQISGISLRTVQSQRYRLAKKLNLPKGQDLNTFVFSI
jgi:hypothetical protein